MNGVAITREEKEVCKEEKKKDFDFGEVNPVVLIRHLNGMSIGK